MMTDNEIIERAYVRLDCAIQNGLRKNIPLSRSNYRAVTRPHGFSTYYWDYRRRPDGTIGATYAFDLLIIGQRTGLDISTTYALSRALQLTNPYISQSLDYGFQGYEFCDCDINSSNSNKDLVEVSKKLFDIGSRLRNKYRDTFR